MLKWFISCLLLFFQNKFINKHKKEIEKFGMFQRYEDSEQYLQENPYLVCEDTANHLVLWCINLEVEDVIKCVLK